MDYKLLILTTDKSLLKWRTLPSKLDDIKNTLNKTRNATWEIDVRYQELEPVVNSNGWIDHAWYNSISYPLFREGYQFIILHFSVDQWKLFKIKPSLRGANQFDTDFVGESYVKADEHTKRGRRLNQFIQTSLHEMWHELCRSCGVKDDLHNFHKDDVDITKVDWSIFDMTKWQPKYREGMKKIGMLQTILELTKTLIGLKKKVR